MKVIIAGTRYGVGQEFFENKMNLVLDKGTVITEVVCGMSAGVDTQGKLWAESKNIPVAKFPADWNGLGPKAGPIRNSEMAEYADLLIAFPDERFHAEMLSDKKSRRSGTRDMVNKMCALNKQVIIHFEFPVFCGVS